MRPAEVANVQAIEKSESPVQYHGQLEPAGLLAHFLAAPPAGFETFSTPGGLPGFLAPFDLLTTADAAMLRWFASLPGATALRRGLTLDTCFFGSTVTEHAPLPLADDAAELPGKLLETWARRTLLMIVKDIPAAGDLLTAREVAYFDAVLEACRRLGFIIVEGQALAYVPIDFASEEEYLARLSASRRKDIRRKLRARGRLHRELLPTGDDRLRDEAFLGDLYALYMEVFRQSEIHFDLLTPDFFRRVLQDARLDGRLFLYHADGQLIAWNLCFVHRGMLVDKYIGLRYPQARRHNLYFVSWMENLAYARAHGLTHYIAGWTDPQIKADLGARFSFTRHAVYVRNALLRAVLRRFATRFESDRAWFDAQATRRP